MARPVGVWSCPQCTLENRNSRECAACGYDNELPMAVAEPLMTAPPLMTAAAPPPAYDRQRVQPLDAFLRSQGEETCVLELAVSTSRGRFEFTRAGEPGSVVKNRLLRALNDDSFVENRANAGAQGGEAEGRGTEGRGERNASDDGAGVRVNAATTRGPINENDGGFETERPQLRQEQPPAPRQQVTNEVLEVRPIATPRTLVVPLEVAAVGAKMRNMAKVGGERVKEIDHFVEERVETEIVELEDLENNKLGARRLVERETRRRVVNGDTYLLGSAVDDPKIAAKYVDIFQSVLFAALDCLGAHQHKSLLRIYYAPTCRANEFVCAQDPDDGCVYANALPFRQAGLCDLDHELPLRVTPTHWPTLLPYWIHRLAGCTLGPNNLTPNITPLSRHVAFAGLFDPNVRRRLADRLFDLCGEAPGFELWGRHHLSLPPPALPVLD